MRSLRLVLLLPFVLFLTAILFNLFQILTGMIISGLWLVLMLIAEVLVVLFLLWRSPQERTVSPGNRVVGYHAGTDSLLVEANTTHDVWPKGSELPESLSGVRSVWNIGNGYVVLSSSLYPETDPDKYERMDGGSIPHKNRVLPQDFSD